MVTKESFLKTLAIQRKGSNYVDTLYDHGVNIIETDLNEAFGEVFDQWVFSNFNEEGTDWVFWYVYERTRKTGEPDAWDEGGNVIPMETDEDLWNFLVTNECFI